jgi:hypothetical protein
MQFNRALCDSMPGRRFNSLDNPFQSFILLITACACSALLGARDCAHAAITTVLSYKYPQWASCADSFYIELIRFVQERFGPFGIAH